MAEIAPSPEPSSRPPSGGELPMVEDRPSGIRDTQWAGAPLRPLPDIILSRRQTNHFAPDPVPDEVLTSILKLGLQAPSNFNLQPWRFVVVQDPAARERLMHLAHDAASVGEAPTVVIAVGMRAAWDRTLDAVHAADALRGAVAGDELDALAKAAREFMGDQDIDVWITRQTMVAVTHMLLAAEAYGVNTALIEHFDADGIHREFQLPDEAEVVALLCLGRSVDVEHPRSTRFTLPAVVFRDRFGEAWGH